MEQTRQPMLDSALKVLLTAEEFGSLSAWCENAVCRIEFVEPLGSGWSRAKLAVVRVEDDNGVRKAVLKYCPARDDQPLRDVVAFTNASGSGPRGFAKMHLVHLDPAAKKPILNGERGLFLLMEYPAGRYHKYGTMALLLGHQVLGTACDAIMMQILVKWNSSKGLPKQTPGGISAREFLREILGRKWQKNGPVRIAVERLERSSPDLYIADSGRELPRPLAAVINGRYIKNTRLLGFRGNAHGDLHVDNIMVPVLVNDPPSVADFEKFVLIDLSTFSGSWLIAVDPAYLLLSIIAQQLPELSSSARDRLTMLVLDSRHRESGGVPAELTQAVHAMHSAGIKLTDRLSLYDEWHMESLAAIAGSALTMVGWDLSDEQRRWFLRLSGMAIYALENMSHSVHNRVSGNDTLPKAGRSPDKDPSSLERGPARGSHGPDARERTSAQAKPGAARRKPGPAPVGRKGNVVAIRDGVALPDEVTDGSLALADPDKRDADPAALDEQVADQQAGSCTDLVNELAHEISGLGDDLSAKEGCTATRSARAIIEELLTALEDMRNWHDGGQEEWHITYVTTIGIAQTQLGMVEELLFDIGERGTSLSILEDLDVAVDGLQDAIEAIVHIGEPAHPPDP